MTGRRRTYHAALQALAHDGIPLDFQRIILLSSDCEFARRLPESADPPRQNHMALLLGGQAPG